ncbi:hypothetical protein BS50DRAFT_567591 [Corynespora cassiicola Philippines]|uniref:Rhodopsin domain-containing protein n=1 Tax=Corynespora cassiicola Philippines TaxID=1448308 RepID=A0A2T2PAY0_CORCC|nr:hypothetical protein BS50DRAFT_567591 [Corynespora cassiicola Philippines]
MASEVRPPPYFITDTDKRGLIVVINATTLSFVWTCLLIRIWLRLKTREWRSDDYFLAAATVLETVQAGLVFHIANEGLGTLRDTLSQNDLARVGRDIFGAEILAVITLLFSKCAVLFLYLRLSTGRTHAIVSWATVGASSVWAIIAVVLIATPCNPYGFWSEQCSDIWPKWQAIGAIDIVTEAAIFFISIYLVAGLNMRRKSKILVIAAFSARVPVILTSALRLYYLHATIDSPDPSLTGAYYLVTTQWHVSYAIMSTTITGMGPFLRPFSKSFSTSYRRSSYARDVSGASASSHSMTRSNGTTGGAADDDPAPSSYQMAPLAHRKISMRRRSPSHPRIRNRSASPGKMLDTISRSPSQTAILHPAQDLNLRPDTEGVKRNTAVSGGLGDARDGDDGDSFVRNSEDSLSGMVITKRTEVRVETDRMSALSGQGRGVGQAV